MNKKRQNQRFFTNPNPHSVLNYKRKKAQVTIFIILGILIVAAAAGYFLLKGKFKPAVVSANLEPAYNAFLSCVKEDGKIGADILESQAGYIVLPDFESAGYMPFSSQLNFLGNPIPYWYYVSGNNFEKEQVPSKRDMEKELGNFIDEKIHDCFLDSYLEKGFGISMGEPNAKVNIKDNEIEINLDMNLALEKANETAVVRKHKVVIKSKLGELYDSARKIYDYEQKNLFLENYGIDALRLYAPVDGVEMTCSPKIWNANEVFDNIEKAIEANTLALKIKGGDFDLNKKENKYFVVNIPGVKENVLFVNSRNWSHSLEVAPSEESIMIAKPIGNHPGMGILGFCYVPYHFVYNVNYPVLVQVYSGDEIFQFPLAVVIRGNKPRKPIETNAVGVFSDNLDEHKNVLMQVNIYDTSLNPVAANVSYECLGENVRIGETNENNGSLTALFPPCANGFIIAKAKGFADLREKIESSVNPDVINLIMDRAYKKTINLKLNGVEYNGDAIINFVSNKTSKTIIYPEQKEIELSEGNYEVQVYVYKNSSIKLSETKQEQCMDVPKTGIGGIFGLTEKKCFEMTIPEQIISNALVGGGKQTKYFVESELQNSAIIDINADSLPTPKSLDDLQENYLLFEDKNLDIYLR